VIFGAGKFGSFLSEPSVEKLNYVVPCTYPLQCKAILIHPCIIFNLGAKKTKSEYFSQ
jgi:hypothetical protein